MFEGDICITNDQWEHVNQDPIPPPDPSDPHAPQRAVVKMEIFKWIDGVMPYVLAADLSELEIQL